MVKLRLNFFFCCFFENAKNLGQSDDAKRRKKRGWPKKPNRRTQIELGNGVETIFDTRFRLSRPFFIKWHWFVLMEWHLPVLNFAYHLPEPRTGGFAHSYANFGGQTKVRKCWKGFLYIYVNIKDRSAPVYANFFCLSIFLAVYVIA